MLGVDGWAAAWQWRIQLLQCRSSENGGTPQLLPSAGQGGTLCTWVADSGGSASGANIVWKPRSFRGNWSLSLGFLNKLNGNKEGKKTWYSDTQLSWQPNPGWINGNRTYHTYILLEISRKPSLEPIPRRSILDIVCEIFWQQAARFTSCMNKNQTTRLVCTGLESIPLHTIN